MIVHLAFLGVHFCANELEIFGFRFEATASFDHLLEAYTGQSGSPNCSFSLLKQELAKLVIRNLGFLTGGVDKLFSISGVFPYLFDTYSHLSVHEVFRL